ncbi:MAG TPA: penicillin-binding transpeptidase domain-containing protein [Patescibacteria group bacterium]|nr:penicillin-binding transpeptidase domain-containing protein [Patescibacteria group bacterium]
MNPKYTFVEHIRTEKRSHKHNYFSDRLLPYREFLLLLVLCLGIGLLAVKLITTQLFQGSYYRTLAESNRIRTTIIQAPRGIIFDRNGVPLVYNTPGFSELVNNKITFLPQDQALEDLAKGKQNIAITTIRHYPFTDAMSHVLGYVGQITQDQLRSSEYSTYQPDDLVGESGIEQEYEHMLKGIDGKQLLEVNALGQVTRTLGQTDPVPGQNITLTLDSGLQQAVFKAMQGVTHGAAIVSTPQGEILSMVSVPSYDPNLFTSDSSYAVATTSAYKNISAVLLDGKNQPLLNRVITGTYPPGSTFKIVTAAAGLQQNIIDDSWTIEDTGVITIGQFSFANWYYTDYGRKEQGPVDVVRAIARSNDIFFYKLADKIGIDNLSNFAKTYGIGSTLGIDLPGEASGVLPTVEWKKTHIGEAWYTGDTYEYGIGQGYLLTTPLQVNAWTDIIANGGTLYQPHLLKNLPAKILGSNLLNQQNHDLIQKGMIGVCATGGVAYPLFNFIVKNKALPVDGLDFTVPSASASAQAITADDRQVTLACKTGTAQIGGLDTKPEAWITVIAPAYHPQIVLTVLVENGGEGSDVAAPIAKQILQYWFERK